MANQKEQWVIPTYNGISFTKYLISDKGRLVSKSIYSGTKNNKAPLFDNYREINPLNCKDGYVTYNIYDDESERRIMYGHRLVWESFVCPITPGMVIDHINAVKKDNRLNNLQMITYSENQIKYHQIDKKKK
jgi:hypothetical protein